MALRLNSRNEVSDCWIACLVSVKAVEYSRLSASRQR